MGYPVSELYNNKIYSEDAVQTVDILANNKKIEYIRKIEYKDDVFESDSFSLGSTITSEVKIEVDNDILDEVGNFNEIFLQTNLLIDEDNDTYETVPIGSYIVKTKDTSAKEYTKLTLYDYMDKLNVTFDASNIVPCTRYELLKAICDYCNLELYNETILNGDVIVNVYDNTLLAKTYVSFIAERAGGFAKVIRDKLYIKNFNELDEHILPSELGGEHITNELKTITKVVYENGIQKFEKGTDDGETIYLSQESPFFCTQVEVDNIYEKLNGLKFQSLDVKIWGNPAIDTGDKIKYKDIVSFAQKDWSWGNGFYGSYKTTLNKVDKVSTVSKVSANNKIKSIKSNINEIEGKIGIIAEVVDENTEQVSNLSLEVDNISSSVSSVEKKVEKVEQSVPKYQVELDIYNITIPVDISNKPLENKDYFINYKTTYEGEEVNSNVSSQSDNTGITFGLSNNQITLSVLTGTAITNLTNEFVIDFSYTNEDEVYEISKKVIVNLNVLVDEEINNLQEQINDTNKDLNNNYTNNQELDQKLEEQKQTITEEYSTLITQTKESWQASVINYINQNGVEKFVNTLVTIDIDGLKLSKSDEDIVSLLNNKGLYVSDGKLREDLANLLMKVDRAGALFKLLEILGTIKEQEIIQKEKITDDKFGECQAWYWIGE